MKKIFASFFSMTICMGAFITLNAQTPNTTPLPSGETVIGNHFHAGQGNEAWTDASSLYFNYRGNASVTHFWNLGGSTGKPVMSLFSNGFVGIGDLNPTLGRLQVDQLSDAADQGIAILNSTGIRAMRIWTDPNNSYVYSGFSGQANLILNGTGNVGIGTNTPTAALDVQGFMSRLKNVSTASGAYTSYRIQGPDYTNGLEIDFFGNNNISSDINWSYGGGAGSAAIMNVNAKPLVLGTANVGRFLIDGTGNVGIGTFSPDQKLTVNGIIHSKEVKVDLNIPAPDYVFEKGYDLLPLQELAIYIERHKHLPEIPSANEMEKDGLNLKEMNLLLLKKVEELTLHIIELEKRLTEVENKK